ncbi:hypothetical protein HG530_008469 [Fusarium avenaceum]|nr:hypothetical protein HG530_008469 [Fusarium avenaceum]
MRKTLRQVKPRGSPRDLAFDSGYVIVPPGLTDNSTRPGNLEFEREAFVSDGDIAIARLISRDLDRDTIESHHVITGVLEEALQPNSGGELPPAEREPSRR